MHFSDLIIIRVSGFAFSLHVTFIAESFSQPVLVKTQIKQEPQQEESCSREPGLSRSHCVCGWVCLFDLIYAYVSLLRKFKNNFLPKMWALRVVSLSRRPSPTHSLLLCQCGLADVGSSSACRSPAPPLMCFPREKAHEAMERARLPGTQGRTQLWGTEQAGFR